MSAPFTTNPLYIRLTNNAKWPSLRTTVWLTGALAAVSLTLAIFSLLTLPTIESQATQLWQDWHGVPASDPVRLAFASHKELIDASSTLLDIFVASLLLFLLSSPIVGAVTAIQTSQDIQSEAYRLMHLTSLTKLQIVQGYIYAGLHRTRLLLAFMIGVAPALGGGLLYSILRLLILQPFNGQFSSSVSKPYHPVFFDVAGPLIVTMVATAGLLALIPLAAILGTGLSLCWRETGAVVFAVFWTSAITLLGAIFGVVTLLTVVGPTAGGQAFSMNLTGLQEVWLTVGLCLLPPIILASGLVVLARRWV
jgi:hypothetical protein